MLLMEVSKYWHMVEFPIKIKMKNFKTFYEDQTLSRLQEAIQPTTPDKSFLRRYTGIYRQLLSQCFKDVVVGPLEMMQSKYFFWDQPQTCLLEKV